MLRSAPRKFSGLFILVIGNRIRLVAVLVGWRKRLGLPVLTLIMSCPFPRSSRSLQMRLTVVNGSTNR